MKTFASIAAIALAATIALPAAAQVAPGTAGALAHFNASRDSVGDRTVPRGVDLVSISSRAADRNAATSLALQIRNDSQDVAGERVHPQAGNGVSFSSRAGGVSRATRFAIMNRNASQDSAGDRVRPAFLR
jgi:hypothetical protein